MARRYNPAVGEQKGMRRKGNEGSQMWACVPTCPGAKKPDGTFDTRPYGPV
ncbi:MAG: hypothetical protein IPK82_10875 [Polyangiaceae bacterium]|nr:hypothetical protein [Polyangiaceae bacterium]